MHARRRRISQIAVVCLAAMVPMTLFAQAVPEAKAKAAANDSSRNWDIFAGCSYLVPKDSITTMNAPGGTLTTHCNAVNMGDLFGAAYFFNKHADMQLELGKHEWDASTAIFNIGARGNDSGFRTYQVGWIGRLPADSVTPFMHPSAGITVMNASQANLNRWSPTLTVGGDRDYGSQLFGRKLGFRFLQSLRQLAARALPTSLSRAIRP
jgi:hypothetical protein